MDAESLCRLATQFVDAAIQDNVESADALQELYAQALRLQVQHEDDYEISTVSDFIEAVKNNFFNDYDGTGYFLDFNGACLGQIKCNVDWLTNNQLEHACFIAWYSK